MRYIAILCLLGLAACDTRPKTAEWQDVCVESHTEVLWVIQQVPTGVNNGFYTTIQPTYYDECDRTEPRCIAGRDGTTRCPAHG